MSNGIITFYKNLGETPLMALERARKEHNLDQNIPMTYAGRLDPMAEGLILILVGDECKNKEKYIGLYKTYEFQILVGFSTDTYDLLGLVSSKELFERSSDLLYEFQLADETISNTYFDSTTNVIKKTLSKFTGTFIQKYPRFSSKTVNGKQLFQLSKDNDLPSVMPEHEVTIEKFEITNSQIIQKEILQKEIIYRISMVYGDFRQKQIIEKWNDVLIVSKDKEFLIISCKVECSGGTYIRQLVNDISEKIDIPMVTYSILRTRVGKYSL